MKRLLLISIVLFSSCKIKDLTRESKEYSLVKHEKIWEYHLLTYIKSNDTILAIVSSELYRSCKKSNFKNLNDTSYTKVSRVGMESMNLNFYYKVKTLNGLEINRGSQEPRKMLDAIYSYKSYPLFIDDCNPLK